MATWSRNSSAGSTSCITWPRPSGVDWVLRHPLRSLETNILGTEHVLRACAAIEGGRRVLIASTSEVYGKNDKDALAEDDDRVLGSARLSRWFYASAKAIDEAFALAYWHECRPACHRRATVQHGRRAPDGALRHGGPALRALGAARRAAAGLWRRTTDALLYECPRRGPRAGRADRDALRRPARSSTSASLTRSALSTWRSGSSSSPRARRSSS